MSARHAAAILFALLLGAGSALADTSTIFPLRLSADRQYLVDASGEPFLLHGDTAWSLIAELSRDEASAYIADRKQRGFNTLLVSLIERKFATNAPANAEGEPPFLAAGDFSRPNPRYFDHAEWVIGRAAEAGLLVLLAPAYLGFGGGDEGWYREMEASGAAVLEEYGRYLARRFGHLQNIVWLHGGDHDPQDRSLVQAIAEGIGSSGDDRLSTVHGAPDTIPSDLWAREPWFDLETVYTYSNVHHQTLERKRRPGTARPIIMLESAYEGEHGSTEETLRAAAYGAILAGAAGHVFGNNPIWHFSGPGIYSTDTTWRQALSSRGAQSMTHLKAFFDRLPWWRLRPTTEVAPIRAIGAARAFTAVADDGAFAVAYLAVPRMAVAAISGLSGESLNAVWFDPSSGLYIPSGCTGEREACALMPPAARNGAGYGDWVLLLNAGP